MTLQKLMSGMIAGIAGAVVFGVVIGLFTLFFGFIPGAIIGFYVGFRWGYNRAGNMASVQPGSGVTTIAPQSTSMMPTTAGDTAFLIVGFFGAIWLAIAVPNLFFGYTGPYRGHALGVILPCLGLMLSPVAAMAAERQARRRLESPRRDVVGVSLLLVFLVAVAFWWQWAEARDQAAARLADANIGGSMAQRSNNV